jgi:peroxiredoxin Q/BCP
LARFDVAYFAASCDDEETNAKFAESLSLDYPILSDPDREVSMDYGLVKNEKGMSKRSIIYIGKDGNILFIDDSVSPRTAGADIAAKLAELGVDEK